MIKPELETSDLDIDTASAMTPMIDVIFTLIAFMMLMINAPLLSIDLDLPEAKESNIVVTSEAKSIAVAIFQETGQWKIGDGDILSEQALKAQLTKLKADAEGKLNVVLTIDKTTYVQRMVDTISILNDLDIAGSQIAINKNDK